MKRDFKRTMVLAKSLLTELERGSDYFMDERIHRFAGYNGPKLDRTEEIEQNSKSVVSLCDEIGKLTKPKEVKYEQAKINM